MSRYDQPMLVNHAFGSNPRYPKQIRQIDRRSPTPPKRAAKGTQPTYTVFCTVEQQNLGEN